MKTNLLFLSPLFLFSNVLSAQCVDEGNVHSFTYDGTDYEIVKENKTYADAAACAVERGGVLVRVDSDGENTALFDEITTAGVLAAETIAPDGGGGSYLWLGGTDSNVEGDWIWDGNNDGSGDQFWEGDWAGTPVDGLYNNWGDEPDDYGGQDGLGLSVNGWPLGTAGQWNDVSDDNELYFIIEMTEEDDLGIDETNSENISIYPNPANEILFVKIETNLKVNAVSVYDASGKIVLETTDISEGSIDISSLESGLYFFNATLNEGTIITKKFVK